MLTGDARPALELIDVRFGFRDRPDFLGPISLAVRPGECWAIVGPNGAGKSTLLRLMAGLHHPSAGVVRLGVHRLETIAHRERARTLALVPQRPPADVDLTVREIVLMGRFPHRSLGLFDTSADHAIAERAMAMTETLSFADRSMATLSGGEAQRVHVAAALAQEPRVLLLDEPTSSLDLRHQLAVFEILRDCASPRESGLPIGVVVVTHDVNLAARFCSHILLLHEGHLVAAGPPADVLTPTKLRAVYGVEMATLSLPQETRGTGGWLVPINVASGTRS